MADILKLDELLKLSVEDLELNIRPTNVLLANGVKTVGDLIKRSEAELLRMPNFGHVSLNEVKKELGARGLKLFGDHNSIPWKPEENKDEKIRKLEKELFECNKLRSEAYGTNQELRSNVEAYKKELKNSNEYVRRLFDMLETEMKRGAK